MKFNLIGRLKSKENIFLALAGLAGVILYAVLYGETINPTNIAWIVTDGWDTFQHQIGWEFYRNSSWSFPIGVSRDYGYPVGLPVLYTDSIPLLAVPFKLIGAFLPQTFQYLGWWMAGCVALQGVFGYKLSRLVLPSRVGALIASGFFLLSPIMYFRVGGHASLVAHWTILAGLFLLLKPHKQLEVRWWSILLGLCVLIHPYLLFMVIALSIADVVRLQFVSKTVGWKQVGTGVAVQAGVVFVTAYVSGVFYIDRVSSEFLGYTANLNTFFNPVWIYGSKILPSWHTTPLQFEGMAYLGVGVMILLVIAAIRFVQFKEWKMLIKEWWPVVGLVGVLLLVAFGNEIYANGRLLIDYPFDAFSERLLGIVRASGRFVWPVFYLLLFAVIASVRSFKKPVLVGVLVVSLAIQAYDLSIFFAREDIKYTDAAWETPLVDPSWEQFAEEYQHVALIPSLRQTLLLEDSGYAPIALYASEHNMTLNATRSARPIKGKGEHLREEIARLQHGEINPDTLYVFFVSPHDIFLNGATGLVFQEIDGYTVLAP